MHMITYRLSFPLQQVSSILRTKMNFSPPLLVQEDAGGTSGPTQCSSQTSPYQGSWFSYGGSSQTVFPGYPGKSRMTLLCRQLPAMQQVALKKALKSGCRRCASDPTQWVWELPARKCCDLGQQTRSPPVLVSTALGFHSKKHLPGSQLTEKSGAPQILIWKAEGWKQQRK